MILVYFAKIFDDYVLALTEAVSHRCDQIVQSNFVLRQMKNVLVACDRFHRSRRRLESSQTVQCYALEPACAGSFQER
jgi:hypothetical protein